MPYRRPVAAVAAVVLILEGLGIAALNFALGTLVDRQSMSLAGLDARAITVSTWALGIALCGYLALCGLILLRAAQRDRAPRRMLRAVLISCAVAHGLLGALSVSLVGWFAFAFMMVVLGLVVFTLLVYAEVSRPIAP